MTLRQLGSSSLEITPVGLGTWAIGGDGVFGWGPQDDADSIAAIQRAVERGINWLDTAPIYGRGHSEKIVARALDGFSDADRPLVFTKVSFRWDDEGNISHVLKSDSIRAEVNECRRRLDMDVLDLCQIHWPAFPPGGPDSDIEEAWTTLAELKSEGKIREIGVSNFDAAHLARVQAIAPVTSLQPPYSMLMRQIEDRILPYCYEHGIGVIVYSPMHNGLLTGSMTRERIASLPESDWRVQLNPAFKDPHLSRCLEVVELLREIGDRHGRSPAELAIAWTLHHPVVTGAIVGGRNPGQIDGFVGALDFRLSDEEYAEIGAALPESIGLLDPD